METRTIRYAKVRFQEPDGKKRTVLLENIKTGNKFVVGREVNNEGSPIAPRNADERIRAIHKDAILSIDPLRQNLKYGTLEPA